MAVGSTFATKGGGKDLKIKDLLGQGLSSSIVAAAVGVDISYIQKLLEGELFRSQVEELRQKNLTAQTERDISIDKIEDRLIEQLGEFADNCSFKKPGEVLAAFKVVNAARRRGAQVTPTGTAGRAIVELSMPIAMKTIIMMNQKGEVVQVGEQTLVTMPSKELVRTIAAAKGDQIEGRFRKLSENIEATG